MGSQDETGGWLPAEAQSGAGHEVPTKAPGGPPSESLLDEPEVVGFGGSVEALQRDVSHVTLKQAELRRLIHPTPTASEARRP